MSDTKTERCPTCRSKCIVTGNTTKYFVPISTESLEKQLAERDAALARCVEALYEHVIALCEGEKVDYEATQSPEDRSYNLAIDHVIKRIRIDQKDAFPSFSSAQATAKDTDAR